MIEHALHERLTVVECAFDRQRVDVVVLRRRHHAPLDVGNAPSGKQHEEIHARAAAKRLDGSTTGVARGRNHDRRALPATCEHLVHEPTKELHGQIFERERRPMEQFENEVAHAELSQWRNCRMPEMAIGLARHASKVVLRNGITDERANDLDRDFRVWPAAETRNRVGVELRQGRGNVKATVARKPRQRRLDKAERRGLTPGGHIAHGPGLRSRLRRQRAGHRLPNGKTT